VAAVLHMIQTIETLIMIHVKTHIVAVTSNRAPLPWLPDQFSVNYAVRLKTQQTIEQGCLFSSISGLFMWNSVRLLGKPDRYKHDSPVRAKCCRFFVSYLHVYVIITTMNDVAHKLNSSVEA